MPTYNIIEIIDTSIESVNLPFRHNKRMQETIEGFKTLHLDRRQGYADVIILLLWKEIEIGTLRYQGDEDEIDPLWMLINTPI